MKEYIPAALQGLATRFFERGERLYIVGGAVRNAIMGLPVSDIDITSSCPPERVAEIFDDYPFAKLNTQNSAFGTLFITLSGDLSKPIEYTTFRKDTYVRGHKPSAVDFTDSLIEDASRRDFTAGAVYYDILGDTLVDPFGGIADIKARILRTVLPEPIDVLRYDGLRLMRLARLCGQLRFTPAPNLLECAISQSALLDEISAERLHAEMELILMCDTAYPQLDADRISPHDALLRALCHLSDFGVFGRLLGNVEKWCMELCASVKPNRIARWSALLCGHSPDEARKRLNGLRMDKRTGQTILTVLPWTHAFPSGIIEGRRAIAGLGEEAANILALLPTKSGRRALAALSDMKANGLPFSAGGLAASGDDFSVATGIPQSKELGEVIAKLFEHVLSHPEDNTRERLIELAREI